jgi:hypothetical protein
MGNCIICGNPYVVTTDGRCNLCIGKVIKITEEMLKNIHFGIDFSIDDISDSSLTTNQSFITNNQLLF